MAREHVPDLSLVAQGGASRHGDLAPGGAAVLSAGGGTLTALVMGSSGAGRGGSRIGLACDELVRDVAAELYLTPRRLSAERIVREVRRRAAERQIHLPAASTVRCRIAALGLAGLEGKAPLRRHQEGVRAHAVEGRAPPEPARPACVPCQLPADPAEHAPARRRS